MVYVLKFPTLSRKVILVTRTFLAILQHDMKKCKVIVMVWNEKIICSTINTKFQNFMLFLKLIILKI